MTLVVSITQEDVYTRLRALVLDVVPAGVEVVQGLGNRAAMPIGATGFVCMTMIGRTLHRTPEETWDKVDLNPDALSIEQGTLVKIQLDCYGPVSGDWAEMLAAILRTDYAVQLLGPTVVPLHADDPIQAALVNGEEQYEERWIVGANLQYNPVIMTPQQFADTLVVDIINVDEAYPP